MGNTGLYEEYAGVIYAIREQRGNLQLYRDYIGNRAIRLNDWNTWKLGFLGTKEGYRIEGLGLGVVAFISVQGPCGIRRCLVANSLLGHRTVAFTTFIQADLKIVDLFCLWIKLRHLISGLPKGT